MCARARVCYNLCLTGLDGAEGEGFAQDGGADKRPEVHLEVPAAHAAEVEGKVGPGRHEVDTPEAVALDEVNLKNQ